MDRVQQADECVGLDCIPHTIKRDSGLRGTKTKNVLKEKKKKKEEDREMKKRREGEAEFTGQLLFSSLRAKSVCVQDRFLLLSAFSLTQSCLPFPFRLLLWLRVCLLWPSGMGRGGSGWLGDSIHVQHRLSLRSQLIFFLVALHLPPSLSLDLLHLLILFFKWSPSIGWFVRLHSHPARKMCHGHDRSS